jgi:ubiquinone biosynthesis protein
LRKLPDLIKRIDAAFPPVGGAPPAPPLPDIPLVWERRGKRSTWWRYALAMVGSAGAAVAGTLWWTGAL